MTRMKTEREHNEQKQNNEKQKELTKNKISADVLKG